MFSKKILAALTLALFLPAFLDAGPRGGSCSSCSGGSCAGGNCAAQPAAPEQIAPPSVEAKAGGYEWRYINKDGALLYFAGKQIGGWDATRQKYRSLIDFDRNLWGPEQNDPPALLPFELLRDRSPSAENKLIGDFRTNGVNVGEMCRHERYSINGQNVSFGEGVKAITAGIDDDSRKMFLSVWSSDPVKRELVIQKIKATPGAWEEVEKRCHVWASDAARPDYFLNKDRDGKPLYCFDGDPCVSLQDADGVELWHDAGFTGGPDPLLEKIRKADPSYRPDLVPGPHNDGPAGHWLWLILVAGVVIGGIVLLTRPSHKDE